tara:strand:- start:1118 stop:1261 length:144 start_codon:yes stop_codon:yes gene_type:complete
LLVVVLVVMAIQRFMVLHLVVVVLQKVVAALLYQVQLDMEVVELGAN